jgi:uncharacterized protein with beta-barrel porin domain
MLALGLGVFGILNNAWGACTNVSITGPVGSQSNTLTLCNFSISTSGAISGIAGFGIDNSGTIGTLTNSGTISGALGFGIDNSGIIGTLTNSGTISELTGIQNTGAISTLNNSSTITGVLIGVYNSDTIDTLINSGTISGVQSYGIYNHGTIGTLTNSNTIISASGYGIYNDTLITTLTNSGTVSGLFHGISNQVGTISTLTNSGTIAGRSGIYSSGSVDSLTNTNSGTIRGNLTAGIYNDTTGAIGTLINSGTILATSRDGVYNIGTITTLTNSGTVSGGSYGIYNDLTGTITTLNNAQGGASAALTYRGVLPTNYNIIVNSASSYGQLQASIITGTSTFGVSSLSSPSSAILNVRLPGVLQGFTAPLTSYVNGLIVMGSTYTYTSASYTYYLVEGATLGTWDLTITACSICVGSSGGGGSTSLTMSNITVGTSVGLSNIGVTVYPVFAGGTLALNTGDSSTQAFSVLSAGGIIAAPSSGSATLSGVFSGLGGLTFTGTGITVFSGANTYSGGTTVTSGTLSVAGSSPTGSGDVLVASAGTLMGTGTISGNVIVNGVLKPGNSPGHLSTSQNVTFNSGATYKQDIAGMTQASDSSPAGATGYYSFLDIGGQFTIYSGATLIPRLANLFGASEAGYGSGVYVPVVGDRFRIATAAGGITGRFTTLTQPAELSSGTQLIAFYNVNNSNSVDLATVPTSYSATLNSNTTNAKSVAGVLDQLLGVNKAGASSPAQDALLYAVAGQRAASLSTFAQALAGEIHAASVAALPQTTQRVQQSVMARLGDYPMAPSQINPALNNALLTGGISATNTSGLPTVSMSTNPTVNPNTVNVTSAAVKDGRAWGEIAYQRTERASNSAGNGFNSNLYQIVTGVDAYSDAELGLKLGGGIALSNTTVSANGGNSTIQQGSLFVYGKMSVLQDYVLDGMASVGMSSTNLSRNDPTGYTGGFSSKAILGNDALVSVGLSRGFEYSDLRVTPYARLSYQYVGQNSYDEGSGAAALNIARFSDSAVRGLVGVVAGSLNKDPLKNDYTYRANLAIGADTSGLLNPTLNTTLGGFSSNVTTVTAGSAFVQVGLYGTVKIADNAYAYAGVSGEARSGQTLYGGSIGLRITL